ncbi:MAG: hypothetical protein WAL29_01560 [Bacteroidales bacterium]
MKNILIFTFLILAITKVNGQFADGITYQAVALDEHGKEIAGHDINGNIIHSKQIDVRFSILGSTQNGEVLYKEVHSTYTDQFGLFSLVIGHGDGSADGKYQKLTDINWGEELLYLKVEIDIKRSGNFKVMGIQQMMAVPFAFHALTATKTSVNYPDILSKPLFSNVATSGDYSDLLNKPILSDVATSGDFSDLLNKPIFSELAISGNYSDIINKPIFSDVATSGNYNDLIGKPVLFDGNYDSLVNKPLITSETTDEFLAVAGQTIFTLRHNPSETSNLKMYVNGVRISKSAYSNSGITLTYVSANNGSYVLMAGDRIQFDYSY